MARTKHVSRQSHLSAEERAILLRNFKAEQEQERATVIKLLIENSKNLIERSNNIIKDAHKTIKEEKDKLSKYRKESKKLCLGK